MQVSDVNNNERSRSEVKSMMLPHLATADSPVVDSSLDFPWAKLAALSSQIKTGG